MYLGTTNPVIPSGESSEGHYRDFFEAGFLEPVFLPKEYILEAVPESSDPPQGKPQCIIPFTFESFNSWVMLAH